MPSHETTIGRDRARARTRIVTTLWPALLPLLSACATAGSPKTEYPRSESVCQYVGLESIETPQRSDMDSVSFVATYRFREPHTPVSDSPVGVKFQVNRTRVAELRSHLESQPEVVCTPDHDAHYQVRVKPLPETGSAIPEPPPPGTGAPLPGPGMLQPANVR